MTKRKRANALTKRRREETQNSVALHAIRLAKEKHKRGVCTTPMDDKILAIDFSFGIHAQSAVARLIFGK